MKLKIRTHRISCNCNLRCTLRSSRRCFRRILLWTYPSPNRRFNGCRCPFTWHSRSFRAHPRSFHRKHFLLSWTHRPPQHHTLLRHVLCSILHLQTHTKRLHRNRNLHRLLVRHRHNRRMDAILPVWVAIATHNHLCRHWKHHRNSPYWMAHLQIVKKDRIIPEMVWKRKGNYPTTHHHSPKTKVKLK